MQYLLHARGDQLHARHLAHASHVIQLVPLTLTLSVPLGSLCEHICLKRAIILFRSRCPSAEVMMLHGKPAASTRAKHWRLTSLGKASFVSQSGLTVH